VAGTGGSVAGFQTLESFAADFSMSFNVEAASLPLSSTVTIQRQGCRFHHF
jgi:hypothetical protein